MRWASLSIAAALRLKRPELLGARFRGGRANREPIATKGLELARPTMRRGAGIGRLLYAGYNLEKARDIFANAVKHRPRLRLTIWQRTRALEQ